MTEELNEELKNELLELVLRKIEDVTEEYFNILREKDFKADNVVKECTFNSETNVNVDGDTIQHFNNIVSAIDNQNKVFLKMIEMVNGSNLNLPPSLTIGHDSTKDELK